MEIHPTDIFIYFHSRIYYTGKKEGLTALLRGESAKPGCWSGGQREEEKTQVEGKGIQRQP